MLLSVIIPIYNSEKFLTRCIDSVCNQSFKDYELILVNDGSNDSSRKICEDYCNKYKNITLINQDNSGVSSARNKGIGIAKGKWITFIDSDDYISERMFEEVVNDAEKKEVDLYIWDYLNFNEKKSKSSNYFEESRLFSTAEDNTELQKKVFWNGKNSALSNPVCRLFLNKIIKENNIYFNEKIHYGEDIIFNIYYLRYVKNVFYCHKIYYYREIHELSVMRQYSVNKANKYLDEIKELYALDNSYECRIRILNDIWSALKTDMLHHENTLSRKQRYYEVRRFLNNKTIYLCLNETDFYRLNFKLKFKYILIKYKLIILIDMLV